MSTAIEVTKDVAQLMEVIAGQNESNPSDFRWWDLFCVETDDHHEMHHGFLAEFAEKLDGLGWAADSVPRLTAICKVCANAEDESCYAEQYREGSGGIL